MTAIHAANYFFHFQGLRQNTIVLNIAIQNTGKTNFAFLMYISTFLFKRHLLLHSRQRHQSYKVKIIRRKHYGTCIKHNAHRTIPAHSLVSFGPDELGEKKNSEMVHNTQLLNIFQNIQNSQ